MINIKTACHSSALTDICIQSGIRILNGRTIGDLMGQLTSHTPRGSSAVDYFLASLRIDTVFFFFFFFFFMFKRSLLSLRNFLDA